MTKLIYHIKAKLHSFSTPRFRRPLTAGEIMDIKLGLKEASDRSKCVSYPSINNMFDDMEGRL